jgi:hypothetical protein
MRSSRSPPSIDFAGHFEESRNDRPLPGYDTPAVHHLPGRNSTPRRRPLRCFTNTSNPSAASSTTRHPMRDVGLALLLVAIGSSEVRAEFLEELQTPTGQNQFDASVLKSQEIDQGQIEPRQRTSSPAEDFRLSLAPQGASRRPWHRPLVRHTPRSAVARTRRRRNTSSGRSG